MPKRRRTIKVVLDTNVFVRNFLTRSRGSPNRRVIRMWLVERKFKLALSSELACESLTQSRQLAAAPRVHTYMARYKVFPDATKALQHVERIRRHHDHLKTLDDCYTLMRQKETYDRMRNTEFRCDPARMQKQDSSHFTSLVVKLSHEEGQPFFVGVRKAYEALREILLRFDPQAAVEIYFDSAHITIKSLQDGLKQDADALRSYLPIISPIVRRWIDQMGSNTSLYAVGIFTNLHAAKGLSVGVKFYPSLPLIQIVRGEVGAALYAHRNGLHLRAEGSFHTMLTHSTGFRARNLSFPMSADFIQEFEAAVASYDRTVFGAIEDINVGDVYVRNGYSDKLVTVAEVSVSEGG